MILAYDGRPLRRKIGFIREYVIDRQQIAVDAIAQWFIDTEPDGYGQECRNKLQEKDKE